MGADARAEADLIGGACQFRINPTECATLHGLSLHVSSHRGGEVVGRDPLHTRNGISTVGWSASDR